MSLRDHYDFYVAGPFFNPEQVKLLEEIEQALKDAGRTFYSPRLDAGMVDGTKDGRVQVFASNVCAIKRSARMIAVLDYLLPDNKALAMCDKLNVHPAQRALGAPEWLAGTVVRIPDSGTVWEMGLAYGDSKPIIGVYLDPSTKPNLMLVECVRGIARSMEAVRMFAATFDYSLLHYYEGDVE